MAPMAFCILRDVFLCADFEASSAAVQRHCAEARLLSVLCVFVLILPCAVVCTVPCPVPL